MKRAFTWHWHLLGLGVGVVAGIFSGHPEMVLPLVAAGELLYLGMLGTNDRGEFFLQGSNNTLGIIYRQGCLGNICQFFRIGNFQ